LSAFIDTFKLGDNGQYIPFVRTDDGLLQQVTAAPLWGPQEALLALPPDVVEAGICGPRGSAKTVALMLDCLSQIGRGHGAQFKAIIFRPSQREFTDLIKLSEEIIRSVWPKSQFNKLKNYWEMPWGETIEFMYMDTPSDFKTVQGKAYTFIGFEELQNFEHWECYTLPFSCLRSPIPAHILPRKIRFTCNPSGASHSHIKHRFRLQGVPQGICGPVIEEDGQKRIMIYSDFEQNVLLNRSDPSYMAAVRQSCAGDSRRLGCCLWWLLR